MILRWIALLVTSLVVSEAARQFKRSAKTGKIVAEEIHGESTDAKDLTLVFVNAIWRHGDRSPVRAFPGDKVPEDNWTFGGGGYGQLSPTGMKQHFELGKKLKARYMNSTPLFSKQYNSREIYVRSSDIERTLKSAMSNLLGMYSQTDNGNRVGIDFPSIAGWPPGYVPIAIHTVQDAMDKIVDPVKDCPRHDELFRLARQSDEYKAFMEREQVKQTFAYLSKTLNQTIDLGNVGLIDDSMFVQSIYYNTTLDAMYPWYKDVSGMIKIINNKALAWQNGLLSASYKNVNIGKEIRRISGGPLINNILDHLKHKISCIEKPETCSSDNFRHLKYYALSAHDTTLAAYFSVLEATDFIIPSGGNPHYSSAILTELHRHTNGSYYVRFLYHGDATSEFDVITPLIAGAGSDFAPLSVFEKLADKYSPGDLYNLCHTKVESTAVPSDSFEGNQDSKKSDRNNSTSTSRFGRFGMFPVLSHGLLSVKRI